MRKCRGCTITFLGRCRDFCRDERDGLEELARERASELGHSLGEFTHVEGYAEWTASCTRCGRQVSVRLDPAPGQKAVEGDAVSTKCERSK